MIGSYQWYFFWWCVNYYIFFWKFYNRITWLIRLVFRLIAFKWIGNCRQRWTWTYEVAFFKWLIAWSYRSHRSVLYQISKTTYIVPIIMWRSLELPSIMLWYFRPSDLGSKWHQNLHWWEKITVQALLESIFVLTCNWMNWTINEVVSDAKKKKKIAKKSARC